MPFKQLEYFLKVVECKSINLASKELFISHQALRSSMNSFESKLGVQLLQRSKSGVSLTPHGEFIYEDIKNIVAKTQEWRKFASVDNESKMTIRIISTISMLNLVLSPLIVNAKQKFPNITIELYESKLQDIIPKLGKSGMIGVMGAIPIDNFENIRETLAGTNTEIEILGRDDYKIIVNSQHPLAKKRFFCINDMCNFVAALYPGDNGKAFYYNGIYSHFSKQQPSIFISNQNSIFSLISQDKSIAAVFPESSISNSHYKKNLKAISLKDFPMPSVDCMTYSNKKYISHIEFLILQMIRSACRKILQQNFPIQSTGDIVCKAKAL